MKKTGLKRIFLTALSALMVTSLLGCNSQSAASSGAPSSSASSEASAVSSSPEKKPITVAVLNTAPPLMYKENGELTGFEIDLIKAIAKEKNLEITWKEMKFDAMIPALQANQIDMAAAGFFIKEEREKIIDFSDSYLKEGNVLAAPKDSPIKSFDDLKGKTIVAKKGAASESAAKTLVEKYGAKLTLLEDEPSMFLEVANKNADALVNDSLVIEYKNNQDGDKASLKIIDSIDSFNVALALPKGSELTKEINDGLSKLKQSGEFDKIYGSYLSD